MKYLMLQAVAITVMSASLSVFADFSSSKISDLQINYADPSGSGSASEFVFGEFDFGAAVQFEVEKQAGSLMLRANEEEFQIDNLPLLADDVKSVSLDDVDFTSSASEFLLELKSFKGEDSEKKISVGRSSFSCKHASRESENEVFDACLNNSSKLNISFLSLKDKSSNTFLSNLSMSVSQNKLRFNLKYKVGIKGYGRVWYETDKIKIRLDSVKTGIFSIKNKVFSELKKMESEKVEVSKPWIVIKLD